MIRTALAASLLVLAGSASAMDYGVYAQTLKTEVGRERAKLWLDGFGKGIGMYNVHDAIEFMRPRFCTPVGVSLAPEFLAGLIDDTVKRMPNLGKPDIPLSAVIFVGLENQFPCKQ